MITQRRQWMAVLALSAAAVLAGCASKVEGAGSFSAGTAGGPTDQAPTNHRPTDQAPTNGLPTGGLPTTLPTSLPTDTLPTGSSTGSSGIGQPTTQPTGGSVAPDDPDDPSPGQKVCDAVPKDQLQKIFGEPATATKTNSSTCEFKSAHHDALIAVYKDYGDGSFTVAGQKAQDKGGTDLTIAGHPACLTLGKNLVVSRTSDPKTGGIVKAYGIYDDADKTLNTDLLTLIVPHFTMQ